VGRIGEFDASQPVRCDGDCADRRVELTPFDSGDDVLHLCDRDEAIGQMEVFGDAPPKVDARAGKQSLGINRSVWRHVVNSNAQRLVRSAFGA
jgi:hypothetical protein